MVNLEEMIEKNIQDSFQLWRLRFFITKPQQKNTNFAQCCVHWQKGKYLIFGTDYSYQDTLSAHTHYFLSSIILQLVVSLVSTPLTNPPLHVIFFLIKQLSQLHVCADFSSWQFVYQRHINLNLLSLNSRDAQVATSFCSTFTKLHMATTRRDCEADSPRISRRETQQSPTRVSEWVREWEWLTELADSPIRVSWPKLFGTE